MSSDRSRLITPFIRAAWRLLVGSLSKQQVLDQSGPTRSGVLVRRCQDGAAFIVHFLSQDV